ncbi:MAG: zinc-dependent peptidase [Phycisphaerales bacterium]|nr:zinc-dependent peptidase [Phycisphaerales bacterium]
MAMTFLTRRRRVRWLHEPLPPRDVGTLHDSLGFYRSLTGEERTRLGQFARILIREKNWEGCGGLVLSQEIKLIIAAQAALLLIGMDLDPLRDRVFPNVRSILVYPAGFVAPLPRLGAGGVITEGHANLGEAHYNGLSGGPVIVSWRDALEGGLRADDGRNLVLHEFAHKLDFLDGVIDGTPPLDAGEDYTRWKHVMSAHHNDLVRRARARAPSVLNYYGATNPAEFFAVATEAYFERGDAMRQWLPELYVLLRGYYKQDTAARTAPPPEESGVPGGP